MFPGFEQKFLELLKDATKDNMEVVNKLGEVNERNDKELKINLDQLFEKEGR